MSDNLKIAEDNLVLKILSGSHLYSTATENSDRDYVGIFIPPKDYILGLHTCELVTSNTNNDGRNSSEDTDCTYYSLPKFFQLAMKNNPNTIELFFVPPENIVFSDEYGKAILKNARHFISKKCKNTFGGHAHSQKQKLLTKNPIGSRLAYIEKFGFDVKFASHLIRLLQEGIELLDDHKITFPLGVAEYCKDIKLGKISLEHILSTANLMEQILNDSYNTSDLQDEPDFDEINELQISLIESYWRDKEIIF